MTLPAGNDGPVDVLVTTTGFEPSVLKAGFTYVSDAPGPPTIIGVTPSSGPASGGILISVEGMDLTPDSEVWFGGNKAEIVTYGGSTGIAVTLPVGNDGPVDVLITTTGFEPSVLKTGFTYVSTTEGPPTITAVTPSSGAASGGFVVAVEGSGFTESSEVWFGGTKAAIVTYGGPTGIAVMLPPGAAGAVDVMITTTGFDPSVLDGGFTYTAAAPPKAVSVLPADGPVDGGAIVVVQGSGFRPESEVWFGPTKATKLGTGSTGITVTLPPGSAGTVDVLVTTAGFDPSTLADAFTYLTPGAPKATAVVPDAGPVEGGVVVLVSGENFSDDSKVWFGPNEANVLSAGPKGISVLLPAGVAGAIDVTVITPGFGPTSLEKAFTYVALGPPKLTAIVPNEGPADGGIVIAVQGENLRPESEVWFGSKKATTVSYGGPDGMAVALPKSAVGTVDVLLLTAGHPTETIPDGFTYTPATADPGKMIVVSQVQPSTGPVAGGGLVLIKGLGFPGGALVQFGGQESQSVTWLSPTLLTAQVPAAAKAGAVDVSVTHPTSGLVGILKSGYAYITDASDPVLEGIKPPTGPAQGGTLAVVTGVGFVPGATFFLGGVPAAGSTVHDGALATLVTPPGAPGAVELVIVNPDGGWSSLDSAFVYASTDKPSITLTGLAPIQGSVAGGTTVNVTGSGFLPGTQLFVDGVPFNASLLGPTALWFQTKPHPAGLVDIAATAPDGWTATLKNAFNFVLVPPFVAAVTPDYGPTSGANDVTITGQGFHPAIEVWFGGTPAAVKTTTGTLLVVVAPPGDEGALVDVTVQNPDSLSDTAEKAYSYTDEAPEDVVAVFSVTPPTGPMSGGTPITLQGHGFAPGTTVIIGDSLASGVAVLSETTLIAVSPPGDKGPAKVQVIVPGKGTAVLDNAFFFFDPDSPLAVPTLNGVLPPVGPVTGGTIAKVLVSPAMDGSLVFAGGQPAKVLGVGKAVLVVEMPPHDAGAVSVSVMLPDGKATTLENAFTYYEPKPGIDALVLAQTQPTNGSTAGGDDIKLLGSGFSGQMFAFMGYKPMTSVQLLGGTSLQGVSPAHAEGLVDCAVTRGDGFSAVLKAGFSYVDPGPSLGSIFPTVGNVLGGTVVAVSGTNFKDGATVTFGAIPATGVTIVDDTVIVCTAPAAAAEGPVDVTVSNPDGKSATLEGVFDYKDTSTGFDPPIVATVVPDNGPFIGGTVAVVYGASFLSDAKVLVDGKPATVHVVDEQYITITTPSGLVGPATITVLNPDGQSDTLSGGYAYNVKKTTVPELFGVTPQSGPEKGGTPVILTGSHFTGSGMAFIDYRPLMSWAVLNTSIGTGMTPKGPSGKVSVTLTTGEGLSTTLDNGFEYVGAPHIDSIQPTMGGVLGGTTVTLAGKNFDSEATVTFGGELAPSVTVLSSFVIKAVTPPGGPGPYAVEVHNPDGQSALAPEPFLYVLPPELESVFPSQGSSEGGTPIILTGAELLQGATVTIGDGECTNVFVSDDGVYLTCTAPAGGVGQTVNVTVDNPDGQSAIKFQAYAWVDPSTIGPAPVIDALVPPTGPTIGGTWGLVEGEQLQEGAWALFGPMPADDFQVYAVSGGVAEQARFVSPPWPELGPLGVTVINPDGSFTLVESGFTYTDLDTLGPQPKITTVEPDNGPTKGGTDVTLIGAGLEADGTAVFFGLATAVSIEAGDEGIVAKTPAHDPGAVTLTYTAPDGQTIHLLDALLYRSPPSIIEIFPTAGPSDGGTFVEIEGVDFVVGPSKLKSSQVMFCEDFDTNDNCIPAALETTEVKSDLLIKVVTPKFNPVKADVVVQNPDGQVAVFKKGFLFRPPPKVEDVDPASGTTLGGTTVTLYGTGFQAGCQVLFGEKKGLDVTVSDSKTITVTSPPHAPGVLAVSVTNPDLSTHTLFGAFTYIPPPEIINVFPTMGPEPGGTVLTIQGKGFQAKAKVLIGTAECLEVVITGTTLIGCKTPGGTGPNAVRVTNPDDQFAVLPGGFVYVPVIPAPEVNTVKPANGQTSGGYLVSITGNHFMDGAVVHFGAGEAFNVKVKNGGTLIVVTAPPNPEAGFVDVKVTNTDGQFGVLSESFEYIKPKGLPGLAFNGIVPERGPSEGGYWVTVYGQGFKQGCKVSWGHEDTGIWVDAITTERIGPTVLKAEVPAYPTNGVVDVRVLNPSFGGVKDQALLLDGFTFGLAAVFEQIGNRLPTDYWDSDSNAVIFDADGDGLNDVLVFRDGSNKQDDMYLNSQAEDGTTAIFYEMSKDLMPKYTHTHFRHKVVDLDGDGDLDLLNYRHHGIYQWMNNGDGSFQMKGGWGVSNDWYDLKFADLNCDGALDVIKVTNSKNRIYIRDWKGNLIDAGEILPPHSEPSRGVDVGDVDKDGDLDVVVANDSAFQNRLYYNNCNNTPMPPNCSFDMDDCAMVTWEGHRYAFCKHKWSWDSARNRCRTHGMDMVTINSQAENDFIASQNDYHVWTGYENNTGAWKWAGGESDYTNWQDGEPNTSSYHCAYMETSWGFKWGDHNCGTGFHFVCEAPVEEVCPKKWQFTDATYGLGKNFPISGGNTQEVLIGDLDNDGWDDVYLKNNGQQDRIYFNSGGNFLNDEGFNWPKDTTSNQWDPELVDFDLDGDLDILYRRGHGSYAWPAIYVNDIANGGFGVFTDETAERIPPYRGEDSTSGFAMGDLDGDGLPDIYIVNAHRQDWMLFNSGYKENKPQNEENKLPVGYFANNTTFGIPTDLGSTRVLRTGDIDGDGDLDIVLGNDHTDWIRIWINDGAVHFFDETEARIPDTNCHTQDLQLIDLNGDGDLDIVATCYYVGGSYGGTGGLRQFVNNGLGHFTDVSAINFPGWNQTGHRLYGIGMGDIDADGDLDMQVVGYSGNINHTHLFGDDPFATGGAYFFDKGTSKVSTNHGGVHPIWRDLNGDGFIDLYIGASGQNRMYHNDGDGFLTDVTSTHLPSLSTSTRRVVSFDFDNDGDIDIYTANSGTNRLFIAESDTLYSDVSQSHLQSMGNWDSYWAEQGDINGDGWDDIIIANYNQRGQLIFNLGEATFGDYTSSMPLTNDETQIIHLADLDGDGRLDLIYGNVQIERIFLNKTPFPKSSGD